MDAVYFYSTFFFAHCGIDLWLAIKLKLPATWPELTFQNEV